MEDLESNGRECVRGWEPKSKKKEQEKSRHISGTAFVKVRSCPFLRWGDYWSYGQAAEIL